MSQANDFEELVRACHGELFAVVLSRYPDRESAKDVLQDVLLSAWSIREKLLALPEVERRRYLFAMARNRAIDECRRLSRPGPSVHGISDTIERVAAPAPAIDDRMPILDACLRRLRPKDRELLLLATLAGLDSQSIADRIGSTPSTVRSRLSRIRQQLRECVADTMERDDRVGR